MRLSPPFLLACLLALIALPGLATAQQCGPNGCSPAGAPVYASYGAAPYYYAAAPCPGGCQPGAFSAPTACPSGQACQVGCSASCSPAPVAYFQAQAVQYRAVYQTTYQASYGLPAPRRGLFGGGGFRPFRGLFGGCCGGG